MGLSAKQGMIRNASNTIVGCKTILGRKFDETIVQDVRSKGPVKVCFFS